MRAGNGPARRRGKDEDLVDRCRDASGRQAKGLRDHRFHDRDQPINVLRPMPDSEYVKLSRRFGRVVRRRRATAAVGVGVDQSAVFAASGRIEPQLQRSVPEREVNGGVEVRRREGVGHSDAQAVPFEGNGANRLWALVWLQIHRAPESPTGLARRPSAIRAPGGGVFLIGKFGHAGFQPLRPTTADLHDWEPKFFRQISLSRACRNINESLVVRVVE